MPGPAQAIKYIDLTTPFLRKIPLAIPQLMAMTPTGDEKALTLPVADQMSGMLDFTGYFTILNRSGFLFDPQTSGITETQINYGNWTTVGAELLITGGAQLQGGELVLELRLFDTIKGSLLIGKRYKGTVADQRTMVKRFCAEVMKLLTGSAGVFDTQFAFVSTGSGFKEIYTCDFDGSGVRQVTHKRSISTFPAWSAGNTYLAYTSFAKGPARVFVLNLSTGAEKSFGFSGVQIAPAWVPNRLELSATLSHSGDQEIYLLTPEGKTIKRLTQNSGIDVEASWSPDGQRFAFVSDRAGNPQVYVQEVGSGRVSRLTFEGKYNTQPSWSPKGDKIAYSCIANGQINIFTIDPAGRNPVQLTRGQGNNEAPSWSPDGSMIAFSSTREGSSRIYVMTAFGTDQRRLLTLPGVQSHPKWSLNTAR
jgi:TolB protein